jgi:hypothetical protein
VRSARRGLVVLSMVAVALMILTIPVAASPTGTGLSEDQYASVRQTIWAADQDFGGYSVDFTTHRLFLHPVAGRSGSTTLLNYVAAVASTNDGKPKIWTVSAVTVRHSLADLRAVQGEILSKHLWAAYVSAVHVDTAVNAVHVGFSALPTEVARDADALFGDKVQLVIEPPAVGATRDNDTYPWWGGDYIYDANNGHSCTAGFPVIRRSNGVRGMLTAGHCFAVNDTIYQHYPNTMGTVRWRSWSNGSIDLGYFDTPNGVQAVAWTGCQECTAYANINGIGATSVGAIACSDGYVSAPADCTVGINWIDGCQYVTTFGNTVWTCGLSEGIAADGRTISQAGDSGGPVYRNIGGSFIQAYGSIVGWGSSTDVIFTEWQAISATFQAVCYTQSNCG